MSTHAINFEETELRLGLPGETVLKLSNGNKRCFNETQVDLKLNISSNDIGSGHDDHHHHHHHDKVNATSNDHPPNPPAKAQVVGWPPVKSFRKNNMAATQIKSSKEEDAAAAAAATEKGSSTIPVAAINVAANFIKVSMDGAPYLRKVDLKLYKSYHQLSDALSKMFSSFTMLGNCGSQGIMKDFMNESKLIDLLNSSEYVPTYEDKDGDWMLVGDVPWDMFVDSCKRLRIMKGSEAIGLAPRALEKCKNRS